MTSKLIDIIIPAYNAHKTILKTLGSILSQTVIDKCKVTIVNDCGNNYNDIVKNFSQYIDINEITMPENGGPGVARQVGIDNSFCPYITFIDADDTFYGAIALELLLGTMQMYEHCNLAMGNFVEQTYQPLLTMVPSPKNMVWVFGKLYKREYLEKNNIRFNKTRSNEDAGFNLLFDLCLPDEFEDEVVELNELLYCWHFNENSITRINGNEYMYNQNLPGYVDNMIYAIKGAEERNPGSKKINDKKIDVMVALYFLYTKLATMNQNFRVHYLKQCVRYYNEVLKEYENTLSTQELGEKISTGFDKRLGLLRGAVQELTLFQFLNAIRGAEYEREVD